MEAEFLLKIMENDAFAFGQILGKNLIKGNITKDYEAYEYSVENNSTLIKMAISTQFTHIE